MPMPEWLRLRRAEAVPGRPSRAVDEVSQVRRDALSSRSRCQRLGLPEPASHNFRMHAFDRIAMLVDSDFGEIGGELMPGDPLGWTDKVPYPQKLQRDREKSKLTEGVVCGFARSAGRRSRWA
jgi:hypothetical protein